MSKENTICKGPGAPLGNLNAFKHGKFAKRRDLILTCRTCAAKSQCEKFDKNNPNVPCVFEKVEKIDLSDIGKLTDFLRHLIELDYWRYRRGCNFEVLSGGLLDGDLIKLEQHLQKEISTLGQLIELEKRRGEGEPEIVEATIEEPKPQLTGDALIASVLERFRDEPSYEEYSKLEE